MRTNGRLATDYERNLPKPIADFQGMPDAATIKDSNMDHCLGAGGQRWRTTASVDSHRSGMIVCKEKTVMGSTRRKFTPEFKSEAVELVISSGKPIAEIARDLGIGDGTLGNWVKAAKKRGEFKEKPLEIDERARLKELEEENRRLRMEREILKKAAAWFAKES
ncbi:transposase, partial [Candidatus Mycobacterium methanotrophicum]